MPPTPPATGVKRQLAATVSTTTKTLTSSPPPKKPRTTSPSRVLLPSAASTGSASTSLAAPLLAFSRAAFIDRLSTASANGATSEKDLLELECQTLDASWLALLQDEIRKKYFLDLKRFLWSEGVRGLETSSVGKVFPAAKDIYAWSRYTPIDKVRIVIIGQDPYHNDGQAHGLCFSVQPGVQIPPSLRNIYKELASEYASFVAPSHGNLVSYAKSGVLLLNTSLTVRAHTAGSHSKKGWEEFTDRVVQLVDQFGGSDGVGDKGNGVVFLAWGKWAEKRVEKLDKTKHLILTSAHPSPLSARRGFFGNDHFKKSNAWLKAKGHAPIDWTTLDVNA